MVFEEGEHTADILMHVRAGSLQELYAEAGHALMATMYLGSADPIVITSFEVTGESLEALLHAFLSELLFLSESENIVYSDISVSIHQNDDRVLTLMATLKGEPFERTKHGGGSEVKGVSFCGMSIRHIPEQDEAEQYALDILFDV